MLDKLRKALSDARKRLAGWRETRDLKRARAREKKRERKKVIADRRVAKKEAKAAAHAYENLIRNPVESDQEFEARQFAAKTRAVDARKRYAALDRKAGRLHGLIGRLWDEAENAGRRARWFVQVRIPKIKKKIEEAAQASQFSAMGDRVVSIDGKPCAEWLAFRIQVARAAGWGGGLNSGFRDPAYSEQLCYQICGQPTCPGRCAGRSSNHAKNVYPDGAIDVSDPATFEALMRSLSGRIPGVVVFNALGAADIWHMSATGR